MSSNDPDFERKAADIIGVYVNPPAHAAVFWVAEKTIRTLDRNDPLLPLSPGAPNGMGSNTEIRHTGAAPASNMKTDDVFGRDVLGKIASSHISEQFIGFSARNCGASAGRLGDSRDRRQRSGTQDQARAGFLSEHPKLRLHRRRTHAPWLNQVKLRFAKISREITTRGVFSSVADLKNKK